MSVLDLIINGIGIEWTYVLLGGLSILPLPLLCGAMIIGPRCRIKRQNMQGTGTRLRLRNNYYKLLNRKFLGVNHSLFYQR